MADVFQVLLRSVVNVLYGVIGSLVASRIERYLRSRQGKKSPPNDSG